MQSIKESIDTYDCRTTLDEVIYYAKIVQVPDQAVVILDEESVIRYFNRVSENLFGNAILQATGKNINALLSMIARPKQAEIIRSHLIAHDSWSGEIEFLQNAGFESWLITSTSPIIGESGLFLGSILVFMDISERKWAESELAAYAQEFSNSCDKIQELNDKLRVVGSLTRHDIRNKLSSLNSVSYLLKKTFTDIPSALQHISLMEKIVQDIVQILNFEALYEQIGSQQMIPLEVQKFFTEATALISDLKGIKLDCQCHRLTVIADSLFRQLLYNLIDNTLKYGQKTTTIKLSFHKNKDNLLLVYEDNGVGISEDMREHLFERGFGKGTGFGLYSMKRVCEGYGWTICEKGQLNEGVKFIITIPHGKYMITP
jgi:PAS domain S-box-containing protein